MAKDKIESLKVAPDTAADVSADPAPVVQVVGVVVGAPLLRNGRYVSIADAAMTWDGPHADNTTTAHSRQIRDMVLLKVLRARED